MKVKLLNKIDKKGLDILAKNGFEYDTDVENPDAILVRSTKMLDYNFNENLLCISRAGAGVNNIPLDECSKKGIIVFNTPGANANGVKELTIASIIMASRNIVDSIDWVKTLKEDDDLSKTIEANKSNFVGTEIKGKTLGVLGLGSVGGMVANAAYNLDMDVLGYDPYISVNAAWHLSRAINKAESYDEVYANSDFITIHIPSLESTRGIINKEAINKMKDGVKIINLARGDLVDSKAIIEAVNSGKISCYVTDFPTKEMVGVKNIICIPHLGASTSESEENCAIMAAREITDFFKHGVIINSVNYPNITQTKTTEHRIIVIHKNIPGMLSQISNSYSNINFNIESLFSQAKNEYAISVLDTHNKPTKEIINNINNIDGVIRTIIN